MRAREFITEQENLPDEYAEPMKYTYIIPGLSAADPYNNYRFGVAMARARSDAEVNDSANAKKFMPPWSSETAFGEHGVVVGFNQNIDKVIDKALQMTKTAGGKKLVSSGPSEEPKLVQNKSPIKSFSGY
jgi:hypothetical protein